MLQIVGGVAVGAAAVMLAPSLVTTAAGIMKPIFKTLVKGVILTYESGKQAVDHARRALAETAETVEDLAAEAKAEIEESRKGSAKAARKKAAAEA